MASEKVAGVLSTKIKMDTTEAQKSMRQLNNDINSTVSILKQQEQEFKSTGDNVNALQTKISRLTETQNGYYEKLKLLKQAQNDVKDRLGESSTEYQKYQTQINKTITTIGRYDDQINKAQKSLQYYDSGLAKLRQSYSEQQRLSQSLVERLRAEGKEWQANQEEIKQSKNAYSNLKQQYEIQENELGQLKTKLNDLNSSYKKAQTELNNIAQSSGKASDAYSEQKQKMNNLKSAISGVNSDLTKQETRLNQTATSMAKARTKTSELSESYHKIPKSVTTEIKAKTEKATSGIKTFTSAIKGSAIGAGIANVAMAGLNAVGDNLNASFERYDTLNNFPKVLQSMGASADDSKKAMATLKQGVDGLPTSLQDVAQASEKLLPMSKNANDAAKSALALNDAFLASHASSEDASRGLQQYTQMLSSGKVDLQSWKTLQETMPASLQKVAKSFGIASGSTQELYKKLQSGEITMDQLNQKFQELDKGANGFHEQAKQATDGIGTAMANLKNRSVAALTSVIGGFDQLSKNLTGSSIGGNINKLSSHFKSFGDTAGKAIAGLAPTIKKLTPLFNSMKKVGESALSGLKPIINAVKDSFDKLSKNTGTFKKTLDNLAPIVKVISNVLGSVLGVAIRFIVDLVVDICKKFNKLCDVLRTVVKAVKEMVSNVKSKFNDFKDACSHLGDKFGDMVSSIKDKANDLKSKVSAKFNELKDQAKSKFEDMKESCKSKWNAMCTTISNKTMDFKNDIQTKWKDMKEKVSTTTENLKETAKQKWNTMCTNIKTFTDNFKSSIQTKWNNMKSKVSEITENLKETAKTKWNTMCTNIKSFTDNFKSSIQSKWNDMKSKVSTTTENLKETAKSKWNTMCNTINSRTGTFKSNVQSKWNDMKSRVGTTVNNLSSDAKSMFNSMYNNLNTMTNGGLDKIHSKWHDTWTKIGSIVKGAVRNVGNSVVDVVNGAIKPLNKMLDGIKDGVNWVLDKFGASKWRGFSIPTVAHFAKGGTVGGGTMAMVNDSGTSNYREMFATPDGRVGAFPKQRDLITYLPAGTQILDGENSKALATMMNIPHFKDGTKDKNIFEKIFDKGKDIMEDIGDIISHPIKFMEKVLKKYLHVNTAIKFASTLISHAPTFFAKQAEKWLKKMAEDFKKSMESTGGNGVSYGSANNPGGAGVARWRPVIIEAFKNLGQDNPPDWKVQKLLRQIATESGGNPNAHQGNIGDINNLRGTPAQGLLQFVPSTFAAWSRPGHNNIYSGLDQLMAAIYCLDHGGEGGWGNIGNGHGWENGGFVDKWSFGQIAEHNKPEVVIPLSSEKQGRALSLLTQTVNKLNRQAGINTTINTNNGSLEQKLDTMIGLLSQLITTNSNGFAKSSNGINTNSLYQQMYRDQTINNYQSI
ncbi:tape measure protein [Ligilactobacillus aviarius]|uniref:Tape measure protein N-terminal domain-containing protein n=1 Tax=Ligilactobacillus aviarius TaxID=1606 RepID=A0A179C443_9LACO|nr:tape measure protein [Ligilactobacillus aviarius]OAP99157.1 hypothetical protein A3O09_06350 [Ligilactobacillus aviarius]OAP99711.1 hypothetical protein A3O08_04605 [Ligilactobacillus aviarius]OAQ00169.1 hypothetical protein A3O07_00160 [Ligilactobacillus aviarius]OAQ03539.1 hypothetical protein A3O13_06440 [Ligilactobacillus aviarius]OAQ09070.1 hypothetical protein A3O14_01915 [Ligilactobacillus aviarius]